MQKLTVTTLFLLLQMAFATNSSATTVAILDSGIDFSHKCLKYEKWTNPRETKNHRDDDRNGYIDDLSGWNFITESYSPWKRSEFPSFSSSLYRYYEIRKKKTLKTITKAELDWYNQIRKDEKFKESLKDFKRFIHGTHVGAIAAGCTEKESKDIEIMSLRYLGDAKKGLSLPPEFRPQRGLSYSAGIRHLKAFSTEYAKWQKRKLRAAIQYAARYADVVNGSFGTSMKSGRSYAEQWYKEQFKKDIPDELKEEMAKAFVEQLIDITEEIADEFPGLLFIFSAGNADDNNDEFPHYPSNARRRNIISVGASFFHKEKAYFSNFGQNTVDVFAPGAAITSAVPDQRMLPVNGTSQASPLVANLAANLIKLAKSKRIKLTPAMVKNIIMDTVDEKSEMNQKCASGGIINFKRAIYLLNKLKTHTYPSALLAARRSVSDLEDNKNLTTQGGYFQDEFNQENLY